VFSVFYSVAQETDTLLVNYHPKEPFAIGVAGQLKGIEIEIVNEYVVWLKTVKKQSIKVKYNKFSNVDALYSATKMGFKNTIGLGALASQANELKEVDFTVPYLKKVSFCVTNGKALDLKTKSRGDIVRVLGAMTALTLTNTSLNPSLREPKALHLKDLKIVNEANETIILDEIAENELFFAYDAIRFWFYVKSNPTKFLKIQKKLLGSEEYLAFLLPKGSPHKALFNQFFNGLQGFKKSEKYNYILEKYLGVYLSHQIEVD
jgi:hypothetical protein